MSRTLQLVMVSLVVAGGMTAVSAAPVGDTAPGPSWADSKPTAADEASVARFDGMDRPSLSTSADSVEDVAETIRYDGDIDVVGALETVEAHDHVVVLVAAGYSRHDGSDPLENGHRAAIYETVLDAPGTYISEVSSETGINASTARYHVRVLVHERLVQTEKIGGKRRLYPAATEHVEAAAALNDDSTAAVLAAVAHQEPVTVTSVATSVERAPSTVSHHISRLVDAGVLQRERDGQAVAVTLAASARPVVEARSAVGQPSPN